MEVDAGSLHTLVPEPQCDGCGIHPGPKQLHGSGVPENVRSDPLAAKRWTIASGGPRVLSYETFHGVRAEAASAASREERIARSDAARSPATCQTLEELRREYEFGLASISGVARNFGVHRRMVREALESSIPTRLPAKARPRPTIGPVASFIDEILEADRHAPRKQRHTAHRIWVRLGKERSGDQIAESTVRQYVRERKKTLGLRVIPEAKR